MFKSRKAKQMSNASSNADDRYLDLIPTDEASLRLAQIQLNRVNAKLDRKFARQEKFRSILREIFYPPLSIVFHIISFITRGVGCIASIGMIAGIYYGVRFVNEIRAGVSLGDAVFFGKAAFFILLPFISFAVAVLTEKMSDYFDLNAV